MSGRSRNLIRSVRLVASRAVLVVAALTLLLAAFRGGTRFFYCPIAQLAFDESPCSSPPADETSDPYAPAVGSADCCLEKWRAAAPTISTQRVEAPNVAQAGLVAILAPPQFDITSASAEVPFGLAHSVRAGPSPPTAGRRRAQLMVFHN